MINKTIKKHFNPIIHADFSTYEKTKSEMSNFLFLIALFLIGFFYCYISGGSSILLAYSVSFTVLMFLSRICSKTSDIKYIFAGLAYLCFWLSMKYSSAGIEKLYWIIFLVPIIYAYLLDDLLSPVIVSLLLSYKLSNYVGVRRLSEIIAVMCGVIFIALAFTLIFYLIRKLVNERDQYLIMSITDSLTGLSTLQHILDAGARMIEKGSDVAVLLLDLDGFKHINDTYGHLAGNKILAQFAELLKMEMAEEQCVIGRFGGDEFILVIDGMNQSRAQKLIERLYYVVRKKVFMIDNEFGAVKLTCTIGSAIFHGKNANINPDIINSVLFEKHSCRYKHIKQTANHEMIMEQLLQQADRNMYQYKYGSNEVVKIPELDRNLLTERSKQLIHVLAEKDMYSYIHSQRTAHYASALGKKLNLTEDKINDLAIAGWLHDVGKICVTNRILRKPGRLTEDEFKAVQLHVHNGLNILYGISISEMVRNAIMYHHERWDGMGYPFGVCGKDTPLEARILQITDTFSALITRRVYQERMEIEDALIELENNSGTQFDPNLVKVFIGLFEEKSNYMIV